jgi:two-component system CheB/CheR fusion protein
MTANNGSSEDPSPKNKEIRDASEEHPEHQTESGEQHGSDESESEAQTESTDTAVPGSHQKAAGELSFHVVGIGASAGGLEALEEFFENMSSDSGMAFVIIQHLDPKRKSMMAELISKHTSMNVQQAEDGMKVARNCVYTIPPNRNIKLEKGKLRLSELPSSAAQRTPIDVFFRSLAEEKAAQAIGIILSGSGSEGTIGLRAIKGEGGLTLVQTPETAKYESMPRRAIAADAVDLILSPAEMPNRLLELLEGRRTTQTVGAEQVPEKSEDTLSRIFALIRGRAGHDFSYYKSSTILRRIERRMVVNQIDNMEAYTTFLKKNPEETDRLFQDLLIGVTSFFRDPWTYEALEHKAIPDLIKNRQRERKLRMWVPGCSTGEEAYSLAIIVKEKMYELDARYPVQIFATDIDEQAVEHARGGVYPSSIAADVSEERLKRFFTQEDHSWRIDSEIREMVVFALQNVVHDPPFSRMDLVSCRNLLIYMKNELQNKLLPLLHYALREDGILFLGSSESVGNYNHLFEPVDTKARIYYRKPGTLSRPGNLDLPIRRPHTSERSADSRPALPKTETGPGAQRIAQQALTDHFSASAVLIDQKLDAKYFLGATELYLGVPQGEANWNIMGIAHEDTRSVLASCIHKALTQEKTVRRDSIRLERPNGTFHTDVTVRPIDHSQSAEGWALVIFEPSKQAERPGEISPDEISDEDRSEVQSLRNELFAVKERLQATIEELETSNEELKSTNEELQSANEELQSTNEELGTAKEEQQSVNEELSTVNSELQQKVRDLSEARDDMENLLSATQIGTIFLDKELKIKRFTPAAGKIVHLIDSDVGRPFSHIAHKLQYKQLSEDCEEVLRTLGSKEQELQTDSGKWYLTGMRPYRTSKDVIDGVVITFVDVTEAHQLREAKEHAYEYTDSIIQTIREPLIVLDDKMRVASINRAFTDAFGISVEGAEGTEFFNLGDGEWNIPRLRELLERILPEKEVMEDFEVEHEFEGIGKKRMLLNARTLKRKDDTPDQILIAMEDVTDRPKE